MIEKLLYSLEELKENYSDTLQNEVLTCLNDDLTENHLTELRNSIERTRLAFSGQQSSFYAELAFNFVEDLNEFPEMYFIFWEEIISFLNQEAQNQFYNSAVELSHNSDATDYVNGISELDKDNYEIALFHFNRINDYAACYFIGWCYFLLENFENSVKNYEFFLDAFKETINHKSFKDAGFDNDVGFIVTKWNIYRDLGYAYNRLQEYEKAIAQYSNALDLFNLEESYTILSQSVVDENLTEFSIFINNYLYALERTHQFEIGTTILEFVISKLHSNNYYKVKLEKLKQKISNSSEVNDLFKRLYKSKKPFNLTSFEETKLLSKEKSLEDLIVEQIKYGYKVFNKSLEIYQDDSIYGRQYVSTRPTTSFLN